MGLFTRNERTRVIRDEHGNVIRLEKISPDEMNAEQYEHKQQIKLERQAEREETKRLAKEAYTREFRKARIERSEKLGRQAGSTTVSDRLEKFIMSSAPRRKPSSPRKIIYKTYMPSAPKRKNKKKPYSFELPSLDFDIIDNWGFLK